jgi:hypothetical protein
LYNTTATNLTILLGIPSQIPFSNNMVLLNTTTGTNTLTVTSAGVYELNFGLLFNVALATTFTVAVRLNNTNIAAATINRILGTGTATSVESTGSIILTLAAGSQLDMAISALVGVGVTLPAGLNAYLSVKRLN